MHDPISRIWSTLRDALFFLVVAVAMSSPCAALGTEAQGAEQKLREYFDFPRQPLEERGYEGLLGVDGVLRGTAKLPALVFTYRSDKESDVPVCAEYPVILISAGTEWWSIETKLHSWAWDDIWTAPDRSTIWAVLGFTCEGSGGEALLLFSSDGGWTWGALSKVEFQHYMDSYCSFRMTPDGEGVMEVYWDSSVTSTCRVCKRSSLEDPRPACRGFDLFRTHDWGVTWDKPESVHGVKRPFQERDDADTLLLTESISDTQVYRLEELRERFQKIPVEISSGQLPGAISLAFDEEVLRRARIPSKWNRGFLEATDGEPGGLEFPYIFEWGDKDGKEPAALIKLPYPGCQWRAFCGDAGILEPAQHETGEIWVIQKVNCAHQWTAGSLPVLPSEPHRFDSIHRDANGNLELHVCRLPNTGDGKAPGRYIYRSEDGGQSWKKPRFEVDYLLTVEPGGDFAGFMWPEEEFKALREVMDKSLAEIRQASLERPAPPLKTPTIAELVELLRKTNWYLPQAGDGLDETRRGEPALHFALTYEGGSMDLLKALLEAGADADARTFYGATALDLAVSLNAQEAMSLLRAQNAPWGGANEGGYTSLLWLVSSLDPGRTSWKGSPEEITRRAVEHAEFLLDHGADVNAKGRTEGRVLEEALEHKAPPELVELLTERGAFQEENPLNPKS